MLNGSTNITGSANSQKGIFFFLMYIKNATNAPAIPPKSVVLKNDIKKGQPIKNEDIL